MGQASDVHGTIDALRRMSKSKEPESLAERLHEARMPVRLLMGTVEHPSGMKPEELELLQQSLPDFAVDSVPGSGQYIGEEQPEAVVAADSAAGRGGVGCSRCRPRIGGALAAGWLRYGRAAGTTPRVGGLADTPAPPFPHRRSEPLFSVLAEASTRRPWRQAATATQRRRAERRPPLSRRYLPPLDIIRYNDYPHHVRCSHNQGE